MIAGHDTTAFINFYLYKENPLFNAYISKSRAGSRKCQVANSLAATQSNYFITNHLLMVILNKYESQLSNYNNIKSITNPLLDYKFSSFLMRHITQVLYSIPDACIKYLLLTNQFLPQFTDKIVVLKEGYVDYLKNKYQIISDKLNLQTSIRINFKAIEAAILKTKPTTN
jgi:hypothetical protein